MIKQIGYGHQYLPKGFWTSVWKLAIPIGFQTLIYSSKGIVDMVMVSSIGTAPIAALTIAVNIFGVFYALLFGLSSGLNVLGAQALGRGSISEVKNHFHTCLVVTVATSVILILSVVAFEQLIILNFESNIASNLISYLRISTIGLIFTSLLAVNQSLLSILEKPSIFFVFSVLGLFINFSLNYLLIDGNLGMPRLGIQGAAIATFFAMVVESVGVTLWIIFSKETSGSKFYSLDKLKLNILKVKYFLKYTIPLAASGLLWSIGALIVSYLFSLTSVESLAAYGMLIPLYTLAFAFYWGVGNACSVIVGKQLGRSEFQTAWYTSLYLLLVSISISLLFAIIIFFMEPVYYSLYSGVSELTLSIISRLFPVCLFSIIIRSINEVIILGILRPGGDIRFVFTVDFICQWVYLIPLLTYLSINNASPLVMLFAITSEEVLKATICTVRYFSKKWQNTI